ncbi:MAG: hypothetical protein ABJC61_13640 [Acidobacteriota bacterium]
MPGQIGTAFALLRVVAGRLFASHEAQKLFGMKAVELAAGIVELFGGAAIVLGLFARPAH